jgi:cystathionine gamma-synthase
LDTKKTLAPETNAAQALHYIDSVTGAIVPPIQPSTTFARDSDYALISPGHSYGRDHNPSYLAAERLLATLEGAESALLFSSGMAAAMAVVQTLQPGDHIVAPKVMYWGLRHWLVTFCANWGLDLDLFDLADPAALARTVKPGQTRLIWIETPCNPTWDVIDIAAAAQVARDARAKLVVDSTVATPVLTRPIELGADIVMHSATKYLNGHGDVVAGVLATARNDELWERVADVRAHGGAIAGSFEAWLLQRGMRTLFLRVRQASASAMTIAEHFDGHPKLAAVLYPGLKGHAGHEIAKRQMQGGFANRPRARWQRSAACSFRRPHSAALKALSNTVTRSRAQRVRFPKTCCACRSASSMSMTSSRICNGRWAESVDFRRKILAGLVAGKHVGLAVGAKGDRVE